MASKIKDIKKKLPAVRSATKAEIAKKLAAGLPVASMKGDKMIVEQVVEVEEPRFVAKPMSASSIAAKAVKPKNHSQKRRKSRPGGAKAVRKSATAA